MTDTLNRTVVKIQKELERSIDLAEGREWEAGREHEWSKAARWNHEAHALRKFAGEIQRIIRDSEKVVHDN
jgi:hypothetical protein